MTPEQIQSVLDLRLKNLTAKEIARSLGLRPAQVTEIIRSNADQSAQDRLAKGEMAPLYDCLVSGDFPDDRFLVAGKEKSIQSGKTNPMGLTTVMVARRDRPGKLMICSYLVDYFCLGVKNVIGPKQIAENEYAQIVTKQYRGFNDDPKSVSLEQAQAIVLSSVGYANVLGLSPHESFDAAAKAHLGVWDEQLTIWCGSQKGKPLYMAGPNDFPAKIMGILDRSVGRENYDFMAPSGLM